MSVGQEDIQRLCAVMGVTSIDELSHLMVGREPSLPALEFKLRPEEPVLHRRDDLPPVAICGTRCPSIKERFKRRRR